MPQRGALRLLRRLLTPRRSGAAVGVAAGLGGWVILVEHWYWVGVVNPKLFGKTSLQSLMDI